MQQRLALARKSLTGISIGDAFGESFFGERTAVLQHINQRTIPDTKFEFTDDTVMAIAVFEQLEKTGTINQNDLAKQFAINHKLDPNRGYGATARRILRTIEEGGDWQKLAPAVFDGMGSMGNGASMRVSPIGAYYYDNQLKIKEEATKSAEITHANLEAVAGAIAVATATAIATRLQLTGKITSPVDFITQIAAELPDTDTKAKIKKSLTIPHTYHIDTVRTILGNGSKIMTQDTVPFSIWCAAHHLTNYEEALWKAVSILGDRDTICAIVGGITIMSNQTKIPKEWTEKIEKIDNSPFRKKPNFLS